ncbi:helix-turn-helix transcriptional regulator [Paenibacillus sp. J31TS4]|uniref:helix-turn-helix domain-containing protein n=1 Tax=Paenibacillus sp. J31TS4 TaxID=2807195 RepID=UPI001BCA7AE2|nr:helix-turn-helix transcriptional regulator [Paenibacillus sp. J31TS4]
MPEWFSRTNKKQVDLARHLGVSESFISQVINGKAKMSVEKMKMSADFLGCHMEDLVEWIYESPSDKRK